jgi:hypothetical protein
VTELKEWSSSHKLALAAASLVSTALFGTLILVAGVAGFAFSIAYLVVLATIHMLLRLP